MATGQFPLTSDGTIDWNFVFEDPADGFVPDIQNSDTPDVLRRKAIHIAQTLHTRDGDELRLKKLLSWIDSIVPENADDTKKLPKMKESILKLVRELKIERINRAERFVEERNNTSRAATSERRQTDKTNGTLNATKKPLKNSFYVLAVVAIAILAYIAYGI